MNSSRYGGALKLVFIAALLAGCSMEANDGTEADGTESVASAADALITQSNDWMYDGDNEPPRQCTVGGVTMHCCPTGRAIIGMHHGQNVFKCGRLTVTSGTVSLSRQARNGMLSCPVGQVAVGFHGVQNALACQTLPGMTLGGEELDAFADTFPMLTCRPGQGMAMTGIHLGRNVMSCARDVTQMQPIPPSSGGIVASHTLQSVIAPSCGTARFDIPLLGLSQQVQGSVGYSPGPGLMSCNYQATWSSIPTGSQTVCVQSQASNACKSVFVSGGQYVSVMF